MGKSKMRGSRHNGRAGKNGVYSVKHNDRKFDIENSEHINEERTKENIYWDCYQGYFIPDHINDEDKMPDSFSEIEARFYAETFSDFCAGQHERNLKNGHTERDRTPEQIRADKRTCPEETIYQLGDMRNHPPQEILVQAAEELFGEMRKKYGKHFKILDWSLHMDEATPHIHERHVFITTNEHGEIVPKQEKALEDMEIPLPDPDKPKGRYNNRKMTFDAECRQLWLDIVKKQGLDLETEPAYGGRDYLEKQDYILLKQKERIADQEEKLEALTIRIEDTERFAEEVSETAYKKAVETVSERTAEEVHNMDFELIENHTKELLNDPSLGEKARTLLNQRFSSLLRKFTGFTQKINERLRMLFKDPKIREETKAPIRTSVLELLKTKKIQADEWNAARTVKPRNKQRSIER